jgi:hypothetical protein
MADAKKSPEQAAERLQDLIRAGVGELQRLVDPTRPGERTWTPLPPIPHAAQLSMLLLLLTQGIERKHKDFFHNKKQLADHLEKIYRKSKACWEKALGAATQKGRDRELENTSGIKPAVARLSQFATQTFGTSHASLAAFGVTDVQKALGLLVKEISRQAARDLDLDLTGSTKKAAGHPRTAGASQVPKPILGGLLVASVSADAGLQGTVTQEQLGAVRVGIWIGTSPAARGNPEPPGIKSVRRPLKDLAKHLPEQQAEI